MLIERSSAEIDEEKRVGQARVKSPPEEVRRRSRIYPGSPLRRREKFSYSTSRRKGRLDVVCGTMLSQGQHSLRENLNRLRYDRKGQCPSEDRMTPWPSAAGVVQEGEFRLVTPGSLQEMPEDRSMGSPLLSRDLDGEAGPEKK
ncbi:UNVERIFIED_CONTAM: hypothetical protein PYX00_001242 [Menopon gallinae]|uniref:Uncharacterized protein n=1 Tax=Menopon gallinae TaxID=328185 RepID=A0AAW2ID57_9NEOP